ncbi:XkdQ/YqbQ family protein [Paenibacillus naphthalenovorans]|uniref:XkdQ/YqbQ family protein n=1 Tax=Paenibacillus naphthalenovorans TaxID=162209 RepID=UPI00088AF7A5|nr:hypothetical protein [Paenibacillus naphthalenovorans]SDJ92830.1 hypothetical protein SAMN05421868_1594 [Paenibacillus naphthalenovorans]
MFKAVIDNLNGTLWDISELCSEVTWKTSRIGKPSVMDVTFIEDALYQSKDFTYHNGNVIRVEVDGQGFFWGRVFVNESGKDEPVKLRAYDQLRYLNEADTYVRKNVRADEVIRDQCAPANLTVGTLANTQFVIPKVMEDGQKRMDICCKALDSTLLATGRLFVLYDDYGSIVLRDVNDMVIDLILGDESLVFNYRIKRSIDDDTYNRVKLVQDNKNTGRRDVYIAEDSVNIAKWGRLQYYQKVDDKLNAAQINGIKDRFLELKNREKETFTLDALGFVGMRAGIKVQVTIEKLGISQYYLVEECTHRLAGEDHTMKLELKVYG